VFGDPEPRAYRLRAAANAEPRPVGKADSAERIGVSVVLRHRATDSLKDRVAEVLQAVCGHADARSGYEVRVDGSDAIIGGTSAVAPLWAGLIARINAAKASPVGSINPAFYRHPGPRGTSSTVATAPLPPPPGWDACSGLGSPNRRKVADAI